MAAVAVVVSLQAAWIVAILAASVDVVSLPLLIALYSAGGVFALVSIFAVATFFDWRLRSTVTSD